MLAEAFKTVRKSSARPVAKLKKALKVVVDFSVEHPARYRLLFNDAAIAAQKGELEKTAFAAFAEFIVIVQECQAAQSLPDVAKTTLAGLLFATMHGLSLWRLAAECTQKRVFRACKTGWKHWFTCCHRNGSDLVSKTTLPKDIAISVYRNQSTYGALKPGRVGPRIHDLRHRADSPNMPTVSNGDSPACRLVRSSASS